MEKGIQIALRYLENKLTRLINRGVLIKLTQSQNNYSNLHFYCSTLVFNIYFFEFAKLLGGPGPPRPLPTLRHCSQWKKSSTNRNWGTWSACLKRRWTLINLFILLPWLRYKRFQKFGRQSVFSNLTVRLRHSRIKLS